MTFTQFEHAIAPRIVLPLIAGLLVAVAAHATASAAPGRNTFVIDETEGYGITDCLTGGKSCGRVVADAWCEAHGLGAAIAYGRTDDVTAAILKTDEARTDVKPGAVIVSCAS